MIIFIVFFPLKIAPYFVTTVIGVPGFPGILCAVLFSGALRSVIFLCNSHKASVMVCL